MKTHHVMHIIDSLAYAGAQRILVDVSNSLLKKNVRVSVCITRDDDSMIKELTSPLDTWMGPDKHHKGFFSFNFDKPDGKEFIKNSYCYPEQNYLTKRFSGQWKYIEFAFQSWALDPCNSFGIHMAAFNPKPWFKQPCGNQLKIDEKYQPYLKQWSKKNIRIPIAIKEDTNENYDNISFSYEIFNEVIIWGLINYPPLKDFFIHDTQIHGTKVSFDRDVFKKLYKKTKFKLLKSIKKGDKLYKKLSKSQQYISDLINDYENSYESIKDKYLQICRTKLKGKKGYDYDFKILQYPKHTDISEHDKKTLLKEGNMPFGKFKGIPIEDLDEEYIKYIVSSLAYKKEKEIRKAFQKFHGPLIKMLGSTKMRKKTKRKSHSGGKRVKRKRTKKAKRRRTKRTTANNTLFYFTMNGCPYCEEFNPLWEKLKNKYSKSLKMEKVERSKNPELIQSFGIQDFPTIILTQVKARKHIFDGNRTEEGFKDFLQKNKVI